MVTSLWSFVNCIRKEVEINKEGFFVASSDGMEDAGRIV
jgi:hypothetical protein